MSIRSINVESLVSNAYYCMKHFSREQYIEQTADLIYQGYYNFDMDGGPVVDKYRNKYKDPVFTIVHNFVAFFVSNDGHLYSNEYDVYCKLCSKCGHNYFSVNELINHRNKLTFDDLRGIVAFIRLLREHVNESYFQNFIYGLIMLALMDNSGDIRESAYSFIEAVLSPNVDNCPSYSTLMSKVYKW